MKIIKDPVHGYVEVDESLLPLLDAPVMQRLRSIRQLGFSYLVYPGANHTRFEHSLGTMHLAGLMARQLDLPAGEALLVKTAALLHDIGHGPYSHAIEPFMEEYTGRSHHHIREVLVGTGTWDLITDAGTDPEAVCALIEGEHPLGGIIHGDLDVDRMDYLLRDAHYTGVPYGTVDAHRLIRSVMLTDEGMVLRESGINAAESLLIARTLMRPAVYFHHVGRIAEGLFGLALYYHTRAGIDRTEAASLVRMDDGACIQVLRNSPASQAQQLVIRLQQRDLFKRALYVGKDQINTAALPAVRPQHEERTIAAAIAGEAGVREEEVLVDIPEFPHEMSMAVQVRHRHLTVQLEEISPMMKTLNETRRGQWRLGVYAPAAVAEQVGEAAAATLHIRKPTAQGKLVL
jgi:hypothetical protein